MNAFLHGTIDEMIYMKQPKGFEDDHHPHHVCKLKKAIYGLKQAPRQWFQTFSTFLHTLGFSPGIADSSLFILTMGNSHLYLVIYVDDILLTGNDSTLITNVISQLNNKFNMKNLGMASSFLGITISSMNKRYMLSQQHYAASILKLACMTNCKALANPSCARLPDPNIKDALPFDSKLYRHITGSLQYLVITRPDISFMGKPELHSYSNADRAGDKETRRSTSGYCTFFGNTLISWSVKKQHTVARSSTEVEYRSLATALANILWLCQLLLDFHIQLQSPTVYIAIVRQRLH
ncbi:uncharacterized protein LOC110106423 [Dendrobium catenatum]|uniref:uncharacterized protein LOC110106423 n=1 Tax=Dendrobium catenatum TaxID=906689 RepID=UPI0009F266A5|nr:uncharacterized protein LOC110106423 [Dendrobium catenatum]